MSGFRRGWMLVSVMLALLLRVASAQVTTTTVQDTVYTATGAAASGTVVVSWNGFTTAAGRTVPTGTVAVTLGAGGALSVALAPNVGATPMGSYYTAVYHLSDGSESREYWVIPVTPAGGGPVLLSAIRNSVLPVSVAMQTVSKSYVDTAIAAAVSGHPLDSSPYVLKAGDTMTGPLVLPGDPVSANQAADKNYVDENVGASSSGLGRKVDMLPSATQVVAQPVGTELAVNTLNGELYASQYVSTVGNDGIANALASANCTSGCVVKAEPTYNSAEGASLSQFPSPGRLVDARGESAGETVFNPLAPNSNGVQTGRSLGMVTTRSAASVKALFPGASEVDAIGLQVSSLGLAGGSNQLPADLETVPYFKSTYSALNLAGSYNTPGQHVLDNQSTYCYGVGDCLLGARFLYASGGTRDEADEGAHPYDFQVAEDSRVFAGTCATGCTTGSTVLTVPGAAGGGTQGEGRFLIDKNPAKVLTTGQIVGGVSATPFFKAEFSGTSFPVSVFLSTATAALSQPTNIAPGTVTVTVATSGVPAGFATNTAALPASTGVACVADQHAMGATGYANFEYAAYTVVDGTHVQLTLNKVHGVGTVLAVGGLCGYGLEQTVDTYGPVRQVFEVVGSTSATELYYADGRSGLVGTMGSTSAYENLSLTVASIARAGNVVTVTTAGNLPVDVNGLTLTVSGVADASYNGSYVVTTTGPNMLTYADTGANSTSAGGTLSLLTGGFALYPMAEVLGVVDPATKAVDGYLQLGANTVAWATGDAVELPHYFQEDVHADVEVVTQFVPRPIGDDRAGIEYTATVGPGVYGWSIENLAPASEYLGNGGTHTIPTSAYESLGAWRNILTAQAGDEALFRVTCNSHGCNKWNSGYSLFSLNSATGVDQLNYSPQTSTAAWTVGGMNYTFAPGGFTAGTINVGTLNATTITGGVSAAAITSGTIAAARLPVFGPSGTTHSAGIVPDPGPVAGSTRFLREDGTFAVPAGGGGGPTGAAGGDLSGTYPNPTVAAVHATTGTMDGVTIGGSTAAVGSFTTANATNVNAGSVTVTGAGAMYNNGGSLTFAASTVIGNGNLVMAAGNVGFFTTNSLFYVCTPSTASCPIVFKPSTGSLTAGSYQETLFTPANSSATCTTGQFADDANYHYVCVAANTWKRAALSSF